MYRQYVNVLRALAVVLPVGTVVKLAREPAVARISAEQTTVAERVRGAVSSNVLVISIDGLRPETIEKFDAETLQRLMREGAVARSATPLSASRTLASQMAMLTGAPEVHRIDWRDDPAGADGTIAVPTVFELAKNAGFTTAAFYSRPELKQLLKPSALDYTSGPRLKRAKAKKTVEAATEYMLANRPNLMFVHIAEPGCHDDGWMSRRYGRAVARADKAIGRLLTAAEQAYGPGRYSVIVTSAHGGQGGRGRGLDSDLQVPWIAWGAGVQQSSVVQAPVKTMDTAATVLWLLGVQRPVAWAGRAVTPAYTMSAQYAAAHAPTRAIRARDASRRTPPLPHGS